MKEEAGAPFGVSVALGDGTAAQIPAADYAELGELLERLAACSAAAGQPVPAAVVWRMHRGEPRLMNQAELAEGCLEGLPILAG